MNWNGKEELTIKLTFIEGHKLYFSSQECNKLTFYATADDKTLGKLEYSKLVNGKDEWKVKLEVEIPKKKRKQIRRK